MERLQGVQLTAEVLRRRLYLEVSCSRTYLPFLLSFRDPGYRLSLMKLVAGDVEHSYRLYLALSSLGPEWREVAEEGFDGRVGLPSVSSVRPLSAEEALIHAFVTKVVSVTHLDLSKAWMEPLRGQLNLPLMEAQERLHLTWLENVIPRFIPKASDAVGKYRQLAEAVSKDLGLEDIDTKRVKERVEKVLNSHV